MKWRIEVTVVVAVVTAVVATSFAKVIVERTAPVWLAHARNIEFGVVPTVEIDVSVVYIVDDIRITIKHGTALTAGSHCDYNCCDRNPAKTHTDTHFPPQGFFQTSTSGSDRLERF
jgi:hypothetical protein